MSIETVTFELAPGRDITIETGKMALLAGGSVTVQQGETNVLVAACADEPRAGLDFFPLQVDYREKFSAAGKFPGGFFKREGRPSEKEILTARMTDRPLRPLFPKGMRNDVQIMAGLLSADGQNEADVLSMLGASAALMVSDIPFHGPVGACRIGQVNGEFVANPTHDEMEDSTLDLVYAGVEGKVIMIEGSAAEVSEETLRDALQFADAAIAKQCEAQRQLAARVSKEKFTPVCKVAPETVLAAVASYCKGRLDDACLVQSKKERSAALGEIFEQMQDGLADTLDMDDPEVPGQLKTAFDDVTEQTVRRLILEDGKRADGRGARDLRELSCEVGTLPRVHGSALFSRGETQSLVTVTLGAEEDVQAYDVITGEGEGRKKFMLHYNFPNFSVGETGRIMGPGRREIGHGALAERCLAEMMPEDYDYTVRCVSDILGSNGSSSMASVCGGSLALMDAGVPLKKAVAGISVGLVTDGHGRKVFLTDILGSEDHFGDMDFKVAGTRDGITGFQLDLKIAGVDIPSLFEAMQQNREARMQILDAMDAAIAEPRAEISRYAPKITTVKINPEKIGALIGPGGKVIRGITERTGAKIDIEEDGSVNVFAADSDTMDAAVKEIKAVTEEAEIGKIYRGEVKTVRDFGAFVEILPGQDGLLHISEMADYRVDKVTDICNVGDWVTVKVIDVDDRGRIRLSRKEALDEME